MNNDKWVRGPTCMDTHMLKHVQVLIILVLSTVNSDTHTVHCGQHENNDGCLMNVKTPANLKTLKLTIWLNGKR